MSLTIDHYRFGAITVDGQRHTRDLIILPERVIAGWWRKEGHTLHPDDLTAVLEVAPEVLVVGTGAHGMMHVTEETRRALEAAGIRLIAATTAEAVKTYNDLREKVRVAAALHLTC
ncbi:MAG: Mth938-like domain-containing protein [Anaerolineae bacterium]